MIYRLGYALLCLLLICWAAFGAGPGDSPRRPHAPPVTIQDNLPPRAPPVRPERNVDKDYRSFFRLVGANGRGVLIVGNANPHLTRYEDVLRVPSGYFGPDVKDGAHLCFTTPDGQFMVDYPEGGTAQAASPFPTTLPTPVPSAAVPSTSLAGEAPFRGVIYTLVRPATRGGITTANCQT